MWQRNSGIVSGGKTKIALKPSAASAAATYGISEIVAAYRRAHQRRLQRSGNSANEKAAALGKYLCTITKRKRSEEENKSANSEI